MNPFGNLHLRHCLVQARPGEWARGQIIRQPNCWEVEVVFRHGGRDWIVTVTQRRLRLLPKGWVWR